jgi:hypothetical protein
MDYLQATYSALSILSSSRTFLAAFLLTSYLFSDGAPTINIGGVAGACVGSLVIIGILVLYYNRSSTQKAGQVHMKNNSSDGSHQIPPYLTNPQNDESIQSKIMSFGGSKSQYSIDLTPDPNSPMKYYPSPLRYNSSPFKYNSSPFKNKSSEPPKQKSSPYKYDCSPMANKSSKKFEPSSPDSRCDEERRARIREFPGLETSL